MKFQRIVARPLHFKKSFSPQAEGSCLVSMGNTSVLCVATIEEKAPAHAEEKGIGWVHAEYSMLPRSGQKRTSRGRASNGGRSQEISRLIGRSLRAALDLKALAPYSLIIDCDVIRADGGTRTASINGGFVAMTQALLQLWKEKKLTQWPLKNFVGAVSCGLVDGQLVMDMDYEADHVAEADLNVVMTHQSQLIEVQGTAESEPFSLEQLKFMIFRCSSVIRNITQKQKQVLGKLPPLCR